MSEESNQEYDSDDTGSYSSELGEDEVWVQEGDGEKVEEPRR